VVTTPKQSGTKRFSATVWNHSELSPSCADDPACHSRHSGQKTLRNAVHSWSFLTVGPAICLRQLNVTEDGQEWRSVTCRSATGSRVPDHADTCMSADITWMWHPLVERVMHGCWHCSTTRQAEHKSSGRT